MISCIRLKGKIQSLAVIFLNISRIQGFSKEKSLWLGPIFIAKVFFLSEIEIPKNFTKKRNDIFNLNFYQPLFDLSSLNS